MGSKKKSTIGYTYRTPAVMIFGTGHWDKLLALYYADKHCWPRYSEYIGINQQIYIDTPNLLGGDTSEGGVEGYVDVFNGLPTQARNSFLVSKLGGYVSALRGVNSMVFHDGFYWGTSNYYKQISALAQRIHLTDDGATQWYDEKAEVPVLDLESAQYAFSQQINDSPNPWYGTLDSGAADVLIGSGLISSAFHKFGENQPKGQTGYVYTTFNLTNLSDSVDVILDVQFDDGGGIDTFDGTIMSQTAITVESGYATAYRYRLRFPAGSGSYFLRLYCTDQVPIGSATRHAILMTCGLVASASVAGNMNPAHILRETIVSQYGGMGRPSGSIDDTNFRAVADTLYDEGFGISTEWSGSTSCADFQQSILGVIDARMYVHPKTGLWTIKLLRDDYVTADLLTLGPRQIKSITSWKRANPDDLPNSVVVTYWSRADLSDATVQSVNPAAVASSGALNTLTNDYTGTITSGALAVRLARRDRVAAGSPLLTAKLVCTRAAADLMPGDPFILSWPALEDDPIVCRVVTTTRGGIVNQNVILEVAEDVFSLADVGSSTVIGSTHANTDALQIGKCVPIVVEAPYYELLQRLGAPTVEAMEASEPGAGLLLASLQPAANAINAIVTADGTEWATLADMSPTGTLNSALLLADSAGLVTTADITWSSTPTTGSHIQIDDELCRFDGLDSSGFSLLGRGCLDTVPAEHESGVSAWAWDSFAVTDEVSRSEGETITATVQPRSNTAVGAAVSASVTMAARAIRPYPPGNLMVNGVSYPSDIGLSNPTTFSWASRNRLTQADSLIDTTAASITAESGVTYSVKITNIDTSTVVVSETGLTDLSYSWTDSGTVADPYWDYVVFATHFDGANGSKPTSELKGQALTWYGSAALSTADFAYGTSSFYNADTNSSYLRTTSSSVVTSGNDLTIEFLVKFVTLPSGEARVICIGQNESSSSFDVGVMVSGSTFRFLAYVPLTGYGYLYTGYSYTAGVWYRVRVVLDWATAANSKIYVNGADATSNNSFVRPTAGVGKYICVGGDISTSAIQCVRGYIDDVRITQGVKRTTDPSGAFPDASGGGSTNNILFELWSERDGYESYQRHSLQLTRNISSSS